MFMRLTGGPEVTSESPSLPSALDRVAAAIAGVEKPAALLLAEQNLRALRQQRGAKLEERRAETHRFMAAPDPSAARDIAEVRIRSLGAEIVRMDEAVAAGHRAVNDAREKFAPRLFSELSPHAAILQALALELLDEVIATVGIASDAAALFAANKVSAPRFLADAHRLRALILEVRTVARGDR